MLALLFAPENSLFVAAFVLMVLIGLVQFSGLVGHVDLDAHGEFGDLGALLTWLGLGRLPLMALLVVMLAIFALVGLVGQQLSHDLWGAFQPAWLAALVALAASVPMTAAAARVLAPWLPRDETTAIELDDLVGRRAAIVTGRASQGFPARARVEDHHGQAHYVMVEPNAPTEIFEEGEEVLLVRREAQAFRAIGSGAFRLPGLEG
ncbi:OB-fold-containig protein [Sphingomonas sp.]|uniref:OB-fold-containig protein n=1 Tax=Sphingomonas sp. TaxID=28214 RepID=UPI001DD846B3|nr:OB-fold-containig protein [Sphingomonas sp.]MBX9796270.1 YqiJ family protein [Sphingomonas sp.]